MPFPGPEEFTRQFHAFSRREAEAFVADLWRSRGWCVTRSDGRLVLTRPGQGSSRILSVLPSDPESLDTPHPDIVVTTVESSDCDMPVDVQLLNLTDLYEMTQFGVNRDGRDTLGASHFDTEQSAGTGRVANSTSTSSTDGGPVKHTDTTASGISDDSSGTSRSTRSPSGTLSSDAEASSDPPEPDTDPPDENSDDGGRLGRRALLLGGGSLLAGAAFLAATGFDRASESEIEAVGLTKDGIVDAMAVAEAHATALEDSSYTLGFTLLVYDTNRSLQTYLSMDLSLGSTREYLTRVSKAGPRGPRFLGEPPASAVYWSDGDAYLVKHASGETDSFTEYQPPGSVFGTWNYWAWRLPYGGTIESRPDEYFRSVFEAIPTILLDRNSRGGVDRYRIASDGGDSQPASTLADPDISDIRTPRLDAVIDERNLIESFNLRFDAERNGDPVHVRRTLDYSALGETTVERPVWAE